MRLRTNLCKGFVCVTTHTLYFCHFVMNNSTHLPGAPIFFYFQNGHSHSHDEQEGVTRCGVSDTNYNLCQFRNLKKKKNYKPYINFKNQWSVFSCHSSFGCATTLAFRPGTTSPVMDRKGTLVSCYAEMLLLPFLPLPSYGLCIMLQWY